MSRIVVKIGSSSLADGAAGLDGGQVDALVDALAAARGRGDARRLGHVPGSLRRLPGRGRREAAGGQSLRGKAAENR